ncbi:MAG: universal stress protein [Deltaproteobacteria bacterium]|nr:universal stress protein [Deltaproteobacteria bacterium]
MEEIRKIMVALAFSEFSGDIFTFAANLAVKLKAELTVVSIINIRYVEAISSIESMGYSVSSEDYVQGIKEERRALLERMIADVPIPVEKMNVVIRVGHPFEQIMQIIAEEKADLVVMGSKAGKDPSYIPVGAIAEKVFRHSPVPVVSYRTREMISSS